MSDAPQGPGWWLASDRRWYPPETHPSAQQPSAPEPAAPPNVPSAGAALTPGGWQPPHAGPSATPPAAPPAVPPAYPPSHLYPHYPTSPAAGPYAYTLERRSVSTGLSGTIQGFMWAVTGTAALASLLSAVALVAFNRYWDTPINSRVEREAYDDWLAIDDALSGISGLAWLCGLVAWILLMIWMNQAHKATQQLWYGPRQWSSGWTVGGWFIPVANAVIPYLVLSEIEKLALAAREGGQAMAAWKQRSALAVGKAWWILLVAGLVISGIGDAIGTAEDASASDVRAGYAVMAVGFALVAVASVCGALYIRRVARRVSHAGIAQSP